MPYALITGASSGIGLELAKIFASNHIDVILVARDEQRLQSLKAELTQLGVSAYVLPKDLSQPGSASEIFDYCQQNSLQVDYLINNAGFGDYGFFVDSDWAKQEQMIGLNITALVHLTRLFLPGMVSRHRGKIMQVASTAAFQPGPTMSVYYATKAFVLHFSEALSNEIAHTGVTVTALCPGATASGFQRAAGMEASRLVKGKHLPASREVAEYGYKAMMKGKVVAIHSLKSKLLVMGARFSPRFLVLKVTRYLQDKSN